MRIKERVIPPSNMKTPILFLIFNRLDTTKQVFESIRQARPSKLYVASDGPREERPDEIKVVQAIRDYITSSVDWNCELHTLYREKNLGCKHAVSSALDWFFSSEEEGIILEDDCVPEQSFFPFCQEMLERYRDDERVMMITGTNYLFLNNEMDDSYFFSKYYIIWGWATWRRAWKLYDINMTDWPTLQRNKQLEWIYPHKLLVKIYRTMFQQAYVNEIDTWDIQWWYSCIFQNGLCLVPKYNLISNVGEIGHFASEGTYDEFIRMPTKPIDYKNLVHPIHVVENGIYDRITIERVYRNFKRRYVYKKILPRILSYMHKFKRMMKVFD